MNEIIIIFTDTHFGTRNNSITWLNSQLDFIDNQLIPDIKNIKKYGHKIRLIHLGDVFDSRSSISTLVAQKVVDAFKRLRCVVDVFDIISGNHDYYSPKTDEYNTLSLLFDSLDINLWTQEAKLFDNGDLYLPWYEWGKYDTSNKKVKRVFTHADIVSKTPIYKNIQIFSGHMHIPYIDKDSGIYNLGSCYALDFADANQKRGYWIIDGDDVKFVRNTKSINFWRLQDEDLNSYKDLGMGVKDYIEIYIKQSNMTIPKYSIILDEMVSKYKNLWVIPQSNEYINEDVEKFVGYDIVDIVEKSIPEHLYSKFKTLLNYGEKSVIMET